MKEVNSSSVDADSPGDAPSSPENGLSRRDFFGRSAAAVAGASGIALLAQSAIADIGPQTPAQRAKRAENLRIRSAKANFAAGVPNHPDNGDESLYSAKWGSYSKGLRHDANGQVTPTSYASMIKALTTGRPSDFEAIQLGGPRPLVDPQAALAFDLEGWDSHALAMCPAPALASAETAGEMVECYWMALCRDVPFANFDSDPTIAAACADLANLSVFKGGVTPDTVFRGNLNGDLNGPLISQFMWQTLTYGALSPQQLVTCSLPGKDYMTTFANWLDVQNGVFFGTTDLLSTPRYLSTMRDLSQWVHVDALYEAYLNACLILLGNNYPLNPGNPYVTSSTQTGFGTFGGPHILSLVTGAATRALHSMWYEKWAVHRRIRPEAYGGLVDLVERNVLPVPLHHDVLNSNVVSGGALFNHNQANNQQFYNTNQGSYLLPMAFSEGSPTHPAYGEGHGVVAGAAVTILKAWFDETATINNPVVVSADGTSLQPYNGPTLTVGGELNKVASNIAVGRCMAGVHWRSDYYQAVLLGEQVAIKVLQEQKLTFNEPSALTFTGFGGETIII